MNKLVMTLVGCVLFTQVANSDDTAQKTTGNNSPIYSNINGGLTIISSSNSKYKNLDIEYGRFFGVQSLEIISPGARDLSTYEFLNTSDKFNGDKWKASWKYNDSLIMESRAWKEIQPMYDLDLIKNVCSDPGIHRLIQKRKDGTFWCSSTIEAKYAKNGSGAYLGPVFMNEQEAKSFKLSNADMNNTCYASVVKSPSLKDYLLLIKDEGLTQEADPIAYFNACQDKIGFLMLFIKNSTNYRMQNIKISYKDVALNKEDTPHQIATVENKRNSSPLVTKEIPYIDKNESIMWLLFAYKKNDLGFEDSYLSSVAYPVEISYEIQETGEVIKQEIRQPLKEKAFKKHIPYGWYGQ